jgi:hypothetical protein
LANILERYGIKMIEFILGFILGAFLFAIHIQIKKFQTLRELETSVSESLDRLKEKIIPSRIEEENGMLYLYNKETNEFLAQGKTFRELEQNVKEKFPNKLFNVPQEELNKYE